MQSRQPLPLAVLGAVASGFVLAPCVAFSQQVGLALNGADAGTLPNLQQLDLHSNVSPLQAPGFQATAVDPLMGTPASSFGGLVQVEAIRFPQSTEQSVSIKPTSTVVWSDNRGTWKSEPPGTACLLQSTSSMNTDSCN
jgi:hypothetical protein